VRLQCIIPVPRSLDVGRMVVCSLAGFSFVPTVSLAPPHFQRIRDERVANCTVPHVSEHLPGNNKNYARARRNPGRSVGL
jgi:hypothetical protein